MGCSASSAFQKEEINIMKQYADGFASSSKNPSKETYEMSSQEFIVHVNTLTPQQRSQQKSAGLWQEPLAPSERGHVECVFLHFPPL